MSTTLQAPYYPIIYVRSFAATMSEIDETTSDPYMGFNRCTAANARPGFQGELDNC